MGNKNKQGGQAKSQTSTKKETVKTNGQNRCKHAWKRGILFNMKSEAWKNVLCIGYWQRTLLGFGGKFDQAIPFWKQEDQRFGQQLGHSHFAQC